MDLNSRMTLKEWRQVPALPGLERQAKEYDRKWEDDLVKRGIVIRMQNGTTFNFERTPEDERLDPLKSLTMPNLI